MSKELSIESTEKEYNGIFNILKLSLWGNKYDDTFKIEVSQEEYEELKAHSVQVLPANLLKTMSISQDLYQIWLKEILQIIAYYSNYIYVEKNLPITVPYVILKGTSAAIYYPHPELRMMGDIDIMTSHEDFDFALQELQNSGYRIIKTLDREIALVKNKFVVELHKSFSSLSNPEQAKYLDDLIIDNISPTHILPDFVNGVVLVEHVYKHLEGGLGLRQIIDWMMFVDKCLPDEKWAEFEILIRAIGLETFTSVLTKMCELYLGLAPRKWCSGADLNLCKQLMDYIIASGNFGYKRTNDQSISENVLTYARTPKALFQILQKQGMVNWKAVRKYKILKYFAWIYQAGRYISRGLHRKKSLSRLKSEYSVAKERNAMFDALGVVKISEGRVKYKDGKYIK